MTSASAPGKLLLFGEYAVLEGAEAVVAAVDRRARVSLLPSDANRFSSPQIALDPLAFERAGPRVSWQCPAELRVRLVLVEQLIHDLPASLDPVDARSDTGAFFEQSAKVGLGSSAALAVAWTRAARPDDTALGVFERALRSHRRFQGGRGSGADVAASTFGGLVAYQRGAAQPVRQLALPADLHWRAIWTGRSADTRDFLRRLGIWQDEEPARYDRAMAKLTAATEAAVRALEQGSVTAVLEAVRVCCEALAALGDRAGLPIVSPIHATLAAQGERSGVAYKPSGAGGGDFGLAFAADEDALARFAPLAERAGASIVPLELDTLGATLEADPEP